MSFAQLVIAAQSYFPSLKISYKDQSSLMQFWGKFNLSLIHI